MQGPARLQSWEMHSPHLSLLINPVSRESQTKSKLRVMRHVLSLGPTG